jgi:hypothetical protein
MNIAAMTAALMVHAPNFGTNTAHVNGGCAGHHGRVARRSVLTRQMIF